MTVAQRAAALDLVLSVYIVRVGPKAKAKEQPS